MVERKINKRIIPILKMIRDYDPSLPYYTQYNDLKITNLHILYFGRDYSNVCF